MCEFSKPSLGPNSTCRLLDSGNRRRVRRFRSHDYEETETDIKPHVRAYTTQKISVYNKVTVVLVVEYSFFIIDLDFVYTVNICPHIPK